MGRAIKLEICLDSLESAQIVKRVSEQFSNRVSWRIELCSNLIAGGGLTPSLGLYRACQKLLPDTDIMVMIRPRIGGFVYSDAELKTMEEEIEVFSREAVKGFVFGCLQEDGRIHSMALLKLLTIAGKRDVTFHRAFDLTPDWRDAFDEIAGRYGVTRLLTSGHGNNVQAGLAELQQLIEYSAASEAHITRESDYTLEYRPIRILPGSGVNADMLPAFLKALPQVDEIHLSASEAIDDPRGAVTIARGAELGFGDGKIWRVSEDKLRRVFQVVHDLQNT